MSSSRREFLRLTGATVAGLTLVGRGLAQPVPAAGLGIQSQTRPDADEVLRLLLEGNERFVEGRPASPRRRPEDFSVLAEGQAPVAAIIACADSRVAPEILFDQGVGDLFVVRIAGNVVDGTGVPVKGSVEYAVAELGVPLVMVLGHSNCGAVKATIEGKEVPGQISALYAPIRPAVEAAGSDLDAAIDANAKIQATLLSRASPIIGEAIKEGKLKVVPARYDIVSGKVSLFA